MNKQDEIVRKVELSGLVSIEEAKSLLDINPAKRPDLYGRILALGFRNKKRLFKGAVYPVVPLYVSSICKENCVYCNFRAGNKSKRIERIRLSLSELETEIRFLVRKGYRIIELVYSSDGGISIEDICSHIKLTRSILREYGGGKVGLNCKPYSVAEYRLFRKSGLDFTILWQETYNKKRYNVLHPGNTEKSNLKNRIDAPERMLLAGIDSIGIGILSGLYDWKKDWLSLISQVGHLLNKHKKRFKQVILGVPRLKPADGALLKKTFFIPTDQEYLLAAAVFNLCFPKTITFVNTREKWNICTKLASGGGALFTFDCKTIPGGYTHPKRAYQFPTFTFSFDSFPARLKKYGLKVKETY